MATDPGEPAPVEEGSEMMSGTCPFFGPLKRFLANPQWSSTASAAADAAAGGVLLTGFRPGLGLAGNTHLRRTLIFEPGSSEKNADADVWGSYCGLNEDLCILVTPEGFGLIATAGWILAYFVSIGSAATKPSPRWFVPAVAFDVDSSIAVSLSWLCVADIVAHLTWLKVKVQRVNRVFLKPLRRELFLWRFLTVSMIYLG